MEVQLTSAEETLTSKSLHLLLDIHTGKVRVKHKRKEFEELNRKYNILKRVRPNNGYDLDKYMKELAETFKTKGWWK